MDPHEEKKPPKPEPDPARRRPVESPEKGAHPRETPRGPQPGGGDESGHS